MSLNFKIVENPPSFILDIDTENFKKDYFKLTVTELTKKYDLNPQRYRELVSKLKLPYPKPRIKGKINPCFKFKHYHKHGKGRVDYKIVKNGEYYTNTRTEEEAKRIVKILEENNWDKSCLPIKKPKYYTYNKNKNIWVVQYKGKYGGCFKTEEEAKKRVEEILNENRIIQS